MRMKEQNILFFTRTMGIGGTENIVIRLCETFRTRANKIVVCSCGGENVKKLEVLGITHYRIPDMEKKNPRTVLTVFQTLKNLVRNENITVIHTHHRMAACYISMLRMYEKCCFITTGHAEFKNKKLLTRFAYKHSNLIACGETVKSNLTDYFHLPEDKIKVICNAVPVAFDEIQEDETIKKWKREGLFVVGNIARLTRVKGVEYYIKAIPLIIREYPQTRFLVVGTGEEEIRLRTLADELSVNEYVWFMGNRTDVQNIMSQIDLIVLSSMQEGLPLTPIEAFSVGKTVVATNTGGTSEIVQNHINGFLTGMKDERELAQKILSIIKDPKLKERLEKNARITYTEKFSFDIFKESYIKYYEEL